MGSRFPVSLSEAEAQTLMWADEHEMDPLVLKQLRNTASLPWVYGVRVMPDVHLGMGATVGSVIAMEDAISPAAVGVDIGCGVSAVRTSLREEDLERLGSLRGAIEAAVPVGFESHSEAVNLRGLFPETEVISEWKKLADDFIHLHEDVWSLEDRVGRQLGTLGSGNHFIELCVDAEKRVWITLHSGSRNIGKELADRHIDIAKSLPQNRELPDSDLAVFMRGTPQMEAYQHDLEWAQEYARLSRLVMLELVKVALVSHYENTALTIEFDSEINCHHNYVAEEEVDGRPMLITRKGAIRARSGDLAIIPGSMGTGSYVVRGLGNPESFQSASHGAGRRMSRNSARKKYSVLDLVDQTEGVESRKDRAIVDEIPAAYKDIHSVVRDQRDLIEVVQHLRTVLCVKG